jgi:surface antigen
LLIGQRLDAKIIKGLLILGFGVLCTVFPNKSISQQSSNAIIQPEPIQFLEPDLAGSDKLYQQWLAQKQAAKAPAFCSCVSFAKQLTGYMDSVGAARNWPLNAKIPTVGGVVVLNESKAGHVAVIEAVAGSTLTVAESNYIPCQKSQRTIEINDSQIIGYWTKGGEQ